ncbi:MAG: replication-relaxation family protein [Actinomycetales bacterium]
MSRSDIKVMIERLSERDILLLRDVDKFRLLNTKQVQRLHFDHRHMTRLAAARACNRVLARLRDVNVLRALERRIGGVRAGSAGFVWYVGPAGERVLRELSESRPGGRRNFREPTRLFVDHTLAVAELAIQAIEASRTGEIEVVAVQTEPANWQQSLSAHGTVQTLKPDLRLVTADDDYENHWFIEVDLATEHLPVILRQCAAYQAFRATGRYQAAHGVFPEVLWVTPTPARKAALTAAVAATKALDPALFRLCTTAEYGTAVTGQPDEPVPAGPVPP